MKTIDEIMEMVIEYGVAYDDLGNPLNDRKPALDEIRAAIEALTAWQPIETAPKNGTDVFLAHEKNIYGVGFWCKTSESWKVWLGINQSYCDPTHWKHTGMPDKGEKNE